LASQVGHSLNHTSRTTLEIPICYAFKVVSVRNKGSISYKHDAFRVIGKSEYTSIMYFTLKYRHINLLLFKSSLFDRPDRHRSTLRWLSFHGTWQSTTSRYYDMVQQHQKSSSLNFIVHKLCIHLYLWTYIPLKSWAIYVARIKYARNLYQFSFFSGKLHR